MPAENAVRAFGTHVESDIQAAESDAVPVNGTAWTASDGRVPAVAISCRKLLTGWWSCSP